MRAPKACGFFLAVLAAALSAPADESWRHKPSTEWTDKEVREVLEKSPWAHREKLMLVPPKQQSFPCATGNLHCFSDDSVSYTTAGPRRKPSPDDIHAQQEHRAAASLAPRPDGVSAVAVVRWASAQTVREAMSRSGKGETVASAEAPQPAPLFSSDAYVLYVDLRIHVNNVKDVPQSGVFTAAVAQNSRLIVKSTGRRILPLRVTSAPLPEFDKRKELALAAYYIYFPRLQDGKPVFGEKETLVRFECPLAPQPIHSEFDLRDMRRSGVPDL